MKKRIAEKLYIKNHSIVWISVHNWSQWLKDLQRTRHWELARNVGIWTRTNKRLSENESLLSTYNPKTHILSFSNIYQNLTYNATHHPSLYIYIYYTHPLNKKRSCFILLITDALGLASPSWNEIVNTRKCSNTKCKQNGGLNLPFMHAHLYIFALHSATTCYRLENTSGFSCFGVYFLDLLMVVCILSPISTVEVARSAWVSIAQ